MPVHLLSDVDVIALSIVDKAANRKRFYLRKQEGKEELFEEVFDLPGGNLIKADDRWSVAYCVVAEPGHRESPGLGAPTELEDEWATEAEIRRAAHRFMKNGGLVNRMHETLEPYGRIVENFVAQQDLFVNDELIKQGSWVVGLEPTDEGREAIENGQFTGVSIQGTGIRTLQKAKLPAGAEKDPKGALGPKAKKCPECGSTVAADKMVCQNCGHKFAVTKVLGPPGTDIARNQAAAKGPLRHLIAFYMKKPHPFTACVRDNTKRFGPERAKRVCATLKDLGSGTTKWRKGPKKINKAEDVPDWFVDAWSLRWAEEGFTGEDATAILKSLEGDTGTVRSDMQTEEESRGLLRAIARAVGISKADIDDCDCDTEENEEEEAVADTETAERLAKVEETVNKSASQVESLANRIADIAEALASKKKEEEEAEKGQNVKKEELAKKLDDVAIVLDSLREDVEKLAEGASSQRDDNHTITKSDSPLAGLLLD